MNRASPFAFVTHNIVGKLSAFEAETILTFAERIFGEPEFRDIV